jgi:ribonuclease Z
MEHRAYNLSENQGHNAKLMVEYALTPKMTIGLQSIDNLGNGTSLREQTTHFEGPNNTDFKTVTNTNNKSLRSNNTLFFNYDIGYQVEFHAVDTTKQQVIYEDRSLTVETIPLEHRMPCAGYLFREKPSLPHIRRDMIDMYGIPVSQINNIKAGQGYTLSDGTNIPHEKLVTPADAPRAYAYCSDTRYIPELYKRIEGINTLYHESTYAEDKKDSATKYCHSTARQAALVAREAKVKKLLLGHYSARYNDENILLDEAKEIFPNVFLTNEMQVIDV